MDRSALAALFLFISAMLSADAGPLADKAEAASAGGATHIEGTDGWRFLPAELRFADKLASPEIKTLVEPAITAIVDFSGQLQEAGIMLVVLPVPPKALAQSSSLDVAATEQKKMRTGWESIMADLAAQGVRAIDLVSDYTAGDKSVYCQRDTHWSGLGIEAALTRLLPVIQSAGVEIDEDQPRLPAWKEVTIQGDLGGEPETVKLRMPKTQEFSGREAPVLLLGDSHVLVFHEGGEMHATGAGLPEQMGSILGSMPETIGVRGSGATSSRLQLARRLRAQPELLAGKKLVIWVFAGREFTEADMWKKIPVFAKKPAA